MQSCKLRIWQTEQAKSFLRAGGRFSRRAYNNIQRTGEKPTKSRAARTQKITREWNNKALLCCVPHYRQFPNHTAPRVAEFNFRMKANTINQHENFSLHSSHTRKNVFVRVRTKYGKRFSIPQFFMYKFLYMRIFCSFFVCRYESEIFYIA
jgi:hypothetical protein